MYKWFVLIRYFSVDLLIYLATDVTYSKLVRVIDMSLSMMSVL